MGRTTLVIAVLLCTLCNVAAQVDSEQSTEGVSKESLKGKVTVAEDTRLPGAEVVVQGTPFSGVTNERGEYSLTGIPAGDYVLAFSMSGFAEREEPVTIEPGKTTVLDIKLELENLEFEVTVRPDTPQLMSASKGIGVVDVKPSQFDALPSLGEPDVFRAMQLMPGVSATNESSSGLYIRGGTPDQNLVLIDGITVYEVDHFFGVFSAFNINAVESLSMYKGGFESRYGGRLSSVVDLIGKSGRNDALSFGGGVSFLSANGYVDVPLGSKGSFMFAARRSFQSPFSDRIRDTYSDNVVTRSSTGRAFLSFSTEPESYFYDLNARGTYDLTSKDSLIFAFYNGKDYLDNSREVGFNRAPLSGSDRDEGIPLPVTGQVNNLSNWRNSGVSASWFRNWSDSFFSRLTVSHSSHDKTYDRSTEFTTLEEEEENPLEEGGDRNLRLAAGSSETNELKDYSFRFDNFLTLGTEHVVGFGAAATRNDVEYHFNFRDEIALFDQANRGSQYAFFLQDTWALFPKFLITPGLRATYYDLTRKTYIEPRLSAVYSLTDRLSLKAAGGTYHQFANRLTREDPLQGDQDFWMMADGDLVPVGSATHIIAGASYETNGYLFDVEGHRKDLKGLSEFASLRQRRGSSEDSQDFNLRERFYSGTGEAFGLEFLAQKKFGANVGWINYTLGRVDYLFPDISSDPFPASHDSTHEFKLVDSYRWKDWTFSGNWVYATGKPYTEPADVYQVELPFGNRTIQLVELGERNAGRLPSYHRLDLSAKWRFYSGESSRAVAGFSAFNVYNNKNVWRREHDVFEDEIISTDVNYLGATLSAFVNVDFSMASMGRSRGPGWGKSESLEGPSKDPKRSKTKKQKIYNFYGELKSMDSNSLVVDSKWGTERFVLTDSSIKGAPEYDPGTLLHVYYQEEDIGSVVTMVVRKTE